MSSFPISMKTKRGTSITTRDDGLSTICNRLEVRQCCATIGASKKDEWVDT